MDSSPDVLADEVRIKRHAVDNDLELLRVRLQQSRPTSQDAIRLAQRVLRVLAGTAGVWWWSRRRRSVYSLDALLVHALDELYRGEQQLVPALQRMAAQASDPELKHAFETHALETAIHVERLQRVFHAIGARPRRGGTAEGLAGIIADSDRLLKRKVDPGVRDAWLIATAQRIEHVDMSAYGQPSRALQTRSEVIRQIPDPDTSWLVAPPLRFHELHTLTPPNFCIGQLHLRSGSGQVLVSRTVGTSPEDATVEVPAVSHGVR